MNVLKISDRTLISIVTIDIFNLLTKSLENSYDETALQ